MASSPDQVVAALRKSLQDNELLRREAAELRAASRAPVAIVGVGCRFPGGITGPDEFWDLLERGGDAVGPWPADRGWRPDPAAPGGAFLDDVAGFDAAFFGISPREALAMDPQQRLLLETAWEAVERAGIAVTDLRGSRTGVFVGASNQEYGRHLAGLGGEVGGHVLTGNTLSVASGRIAYVLGTEGPALTVDTACSSSLVALHLAATALRNGECDRALVGGVAVMSTPEAFAEFARQGGLAGDGRCKAFSDDADGTGWGEGVGVLVVERLSDARAAGRRVWGVLRGSAVNSDGASNGLTAPNGPSQERVILAALASAGLRAGEVDAVEAHGTGTPLGDPIEAHALLSTYGRDREEPLRLGSVKSNIGHTQAAAGVAGVIKALLSLRHGVVPASLHLGTPSTRVVWDGGKVEPATSAAPLPSVGRPRRIGVSSFGISGTNAHVIVEEATEVPDPSDGPDASRTGGSVSPPQGPADADPREPAPWLLSARDPEALAALADRLRALATPTGARPPAADVAVALASRRSALSHRAVVLSDDDRAASLAALARGESGPGVVTGEVRRGTTAVLLPGQGSQRPGMGRELCARFDSFATDFDAVCQAFEPHLERPLREVVWGDDAELLADTRWAQPALFAMQVAGFGLLRSWGLYPDVLVGHSVGEMAAAHLAGSLSLDDAAELVAVRALAMAELPAGGAMAAVSGSPTDLRELVAHLPDDVVVAAHNAGTSLVLSGDTTALDTVLAGAGDALRTTRLVTSHAFHSPAMAPAAVPVTSVAAGLDWSPPRIPVVSTVTGRPVGPRTWADPNHWGGQLTATVRFADAVAHAVDELGARRVVEIGAHPSLVGHVGADHPDVLAVALGHRDLDPAFAAHRAAAALWCSDADLPHWVPSDPGDVAGQHCARHVDLPTYPFTHQRFWAGTVAEDDDAAASTGGLHTVDWVEAGPGPSDGPDASGPDPRWITVEQGLPVAATATRALAALQDAARADDGPWIVVTRGAAAAGPDERPDPAQAAVRGLALSAMVEHPGRFLLLDLPTGDDPTHDRSLLPTATDPDIAVREGRRLVPRWREPGPAGEQLTEGGPTAAAGPVLIVGGTGGVGAVLARHLVGTGTSHLVLASRRGPDAPEAVALGEELTAAGARVDVVACDAADADAVAAALRALPAPPSLVVHAAGVLDDGLLDAQDAARLAAVLRAKIDTVEVLDAAVDDRTELIAFSSIVGELGSAGQSGYAAANAALDAWATARRRDGAHRRAIAWGPWSLDAGMTARTGDGPAPTHQDRNGVVALTPRTGVALFEAARSRAEPVLVAAPLHRGWLASAGPLLPPPWRDLAPALPTAGTAGSDAAASAWATRLAGLDPAARTAAALELVQVEAAAALGHRGPREATASVGADRDFRGLGADSLTSVELRNRLSAVIRRRLPATVAFDHPTPRRLAEHLTALLTGSPGEEGPTLVRAPALDEPVAVVGIGCRFPGGVAGPDDLWDLVDAGVDTIGPPPRDRGWDLARHADAVRSGAFLDDVAGFDAEFFSISAREALAMDPQQRLLMEVSWEALERASVDPTALHGSRTGVFVGTNGQDYPLLLAASDTDASAHAGTGNAASVLSGRVAYVLGLRGPALTVDTACSSSLVSLHLAAASLRSGECDLALAGGVTVMSGPGVFVDFARQGGLAADGRCKAFSDDADGTAWGEGAGVLVLQRLSDAVAAGRPVLAVVRGSAVNSDGASNGLTAPSGPSQERVIRDALASAGLAPDEVDAVEAHGTGTRLGDPIEAQALLATYGRDRGEPLRVGSVKSNIGHTQAAAGVAGVIKMIGALRHGRLPATLHVGEPSRHVDWDSGAVSVLAEPAEWPAVQRPRRAGISSFGLSGTNAHVVIEQAPVPPEDSKDAVEPVEPGSDPGPAPLVLSARTPSALAELAGRLAERLAAPDPTPMAPTPMVLPAVAASLARRTRFEHRAVLLTGGLGAGGDLESVRAPLGALAEGVHHPALVTGTVRPGGTGLLLPGQGAQRPGMGRGLAAEFPVFAEAFDDACAALDPFLDRPLRDVCWGDDAQCLADTRWAQPALFALQVAGYRLLAAWGLEPSVVIGHSVGEIAAAHLCAALSLDDAARLAATRGRLMAELPGGGSMAALSGPSAALAATAAELPDGVAVAARNSSTGLVLSGESAALEALLGGLDPAVRVSRLHTSHAFHSPLVAPAAQAMAAAAGELAWAPPRLPAASTVSGEMVAEQTWSDPGHWSGQLTSTVLFAEAVSAATVATGVARWAEVGVHPTLIGHVRADQDTVAVCLGHADEPAGVAARRAAARLWCAGAELPRWLPDTGPHADLPTYPFEHRHYWPAIRPANDLTRLRVAWTALDQVDRVPGGRWILLTGSRGPADPTTATLRETLDARVVGTDAELRRALAGPDPVAGVLAVVGDAGEVPDLVRAVVAGGGTDTRLWCLTRGAVRWEGGDESPGGARSDGRRSRAADVGPDPRAASVWGIGRSAALEHPTVWGGLVDLSDPADDPAAEVAAVAGVLAGGGEDQVAVRGGRAYGRRLVPAPDAGDPWQPSGTVLVTGGTGALGSHVARWAAKHGAERIVLTGRRGPDAPESAALRSEIEALGVTVELAAVDAADQDAVTALIAGLAVAGPPLTTVVHAAGVLDDTPVAESDAALISATALPKAVGAAFLDAATRGRDVDLVVLTSVAGVWGSGGQGAYAAANAEADAVVVGRRAAGERAVALAWGPWDGAGMAADPRARGALSRRGLRPIDPDRALAVLPELVRGPDPVVVVADLDLDRFVATFTAARAAALLNALVAPASAAAGLHDQASGAAPPWRTIWSEASPDHRRDVLAGLLRTEVGAVLDHPSPATIDVTTAFRDLGLDSVTSVELRDRTRAGTGLDLPASLAFDHPSIEELATEIDAALAAEANAGTDTGTDAGDLVAALDRLAPRLRAARLDGRTEDVRSRLRDLLDTLPDPDEPQGRGPEAHGPGSSAAGRNGAGSDHSGLNGVQPDDQGFSAREQLADADDDALFEFIDSVIGRR